MGQPSELEDGSGSESAGVDAPSCASCAVRPGLHGISAWAHVRTASSLICAPNCESCQAVVTGSFHMLSWLAYHYRMLECTQHMQAQRQCLPHPVNPGIAAPLTPSPAQALAATRAITRQEMAMPQVAGGASSSTLHQLPAGLAPQVRCSKRQHSSSALCCQDQV